MSEPVGPGNGNFGEQTPADGITAGRLLRQAREAAGLHVAALAVSLKVPVRKLEALEEDRFDLLPDAVFVRALASSVCRTLKIDPQPVLQRLPQTAAPRLVQDRDGINTPFRSPSDNAGPSWRDPLKRPVVLVVAALLVGVVVMMVLPSREESATTTTVAAQSEAMSPAMPLVVTAPAEPPIPAAAPAPALSTPVVSPTAVVTPSPAAARAASAAARSASLPKVPTATATITAAKTATATATVTASVTALPTTGMVVFKAKGPSWIQVTDAKGTSVLRKLLAEGETVGASGAVPLTVTVGSVSVTQVEVRGKPFDLGPVSRDNVARFEVK